MNIYNEKKTKVLKEEDLDMEKGYLKTDTLTKHIKAQKGVEEKGHYEVIKEYENGGKDVKWVVDAKGVEPIEEHDEYEQIEVYVPYTKEELEKIEQDKIVEQINELKQTLSATDYKTLKYVDGYYTEEEYAEIKAYRESLREQIRELEVKINPAKENAIYE